jgi:hypothetical protein
MKIPDEKAQEPAKSDGHEPDPTDASEGVRGLARLDSEVEREADSSDLMKKLAMSRGLQSLWAAVLPMVGVRASRAGEFPGVFQVEQGSDPHEALVHIDIPTSPYAPGEKPTMGRVVSLSVKLAHDFRRLGDRYYCIDCEAPAEETRH